MRERERTVLDQVSYLTELLWRRQSGFLDMANGQAPPPNRAAKRETPSGPLSFSPPYVHLSLSLSRSPSAATSFFFLFFLTLTKQQTLSFYSHFFPHCPLLRLDVKQMKRTDSKSSNEVFLGFGYIVISLSLSLCICIGIM